MLLIVRPTNCSMIDTVLQTGWYQIVMFISVDTLHIDQSGESDALGS